MSENAQRLEDEEERYELDARRYELEERDRMFLFLLGMKLTLT